MTFYCCTWITFLIWENRDGFGDCTRNSWCLVSKRSVAVTEKQSSGFGRRSSCSSVLLQSCLVSVATWIQVSWTRVNVSWHAAISTVLTNVFLMRQSKTAAGRDLKQKMDLTTVPPSCTWKEWACANMCAYVECVWEVVTMHTAFPNNGLYNIISGCAQ